MMGSLWWGLIRVPMRVVMRVVIRVLMGSLRHGRIRLLRLLRLLRLQQLLRLLLHLLLYRCLRLPLLSERETTTQLNWTAPPAPTSPKSWRV